MATMTAGTAGGDLAPLYRETLAAVRDALDIPHAATAAWNEKRTEILDERITHVVTMLRRILADDADTDVAWHVAYLRERLAEHPPAGYVTDEEAHAAVERGMSWTEAVAR